MEPHTKRILGYNLLSLLVLTVMLRVFSQGNGAALGFLLLMALGITLLALANLAGAVSSSGHRKDYLLGLLLVLLIGFGMCMGAANTY